MKVFKLFISHNRKSQQYYLMLTNQGIMVYMYFLLPRVITINSTINETVISSCLLAFYVLLSNFSIWCLKCAYTTSVFMFGF